MTEAEAEALAEAMLAAGNGKKWQKKAAPQLNSRASGRWFVTPLDGGTSRMVKTRTRRDPHDKKKREIKSKHHQRAYSMRVQFV